MEIKPSLAYAVTSRTNSLCVISIKGGSCAFRRCGGECNSQNTRSLNQVRYRWRLFKTGEKARNKNAKAQRWGREGGRADLGRTIGAVTEGATAERSKTRQGWYSPECTNAGVVEADRPSLLSAKGT